MKRVEKLVQAAELIREDSPPRFPDHVFANADRRTIHHSDAEAVEPWVSHEFYAGERCLGFLEFYASGEIWTIHPYRNGLRQEFSKCGKIRSHQERRDGDRIGTSFSWHENGNLASAQECHTEKPIRATWNEAGVLTRLEKRLAKDVTSFVCLHCQHDNLWEGAGHAGIADRGFLYNEDGNFVFSWSSYDSEYHSIVGEVVQPWCLSQDQREAFEARVRPAPSGGRFLFSNHGRCEVCKEVLADPLPETFYLYDSKKIIESGLSYPGGPLSKYLI